IRAVGYWPARSFSSDFTMSQIVRRATLTPYRASISTPVLYLASTVVVAQMRSVWTSKTTLAAVIGTGWVWGRTCQTLFIACNAATSAAGSGSPFSTRCVRTAPIVAGLSRIAPVATALRRTSRFLPMSTIFAIVSQGKRCALFHRAAFVNTIRRDASRSSTRHARARGLCQVLLSDAKRVIYDAGAYCGCVRIGCAQEGMGTEAASAGSENDPLAAPS